MRTDCKHSYSFSVPYINRWRGATRQRLGHASKIRIIHPNELEFGPAPEVGAFDFDVDLREISRVSLALY